MYNDRHLNELALVQHLSQLILSFSDFYHLVEQCWAVWLNAKLDAIICFIPLIPNSDQSLFMTTYVQCNIEKLSVIHCCGQSLSTNPLNMINSFSLWELRSRCLLSCSLMAHSDKHKSYHRQTDRQTDRQTVKQWIVSIEGGCGCVKHRDELSWRFER